MNVPDYFIPLVVALPLLGAFLTPLISRLNRKVRNAFVIIILGANGVLISLLTSDVLANGIRTYVFGATDLSLPVVRILFEVDAMSVFMMLIAAILSFVGVLYALSFMKEYSGLDKFYTLVLLMTAGMLGMMMTGDLFNFFVFLEITSIASCALIAFWTHKGESVEAAFKYIVISAIGALFVLFAIALLYGQYNALNMAVIANSIQYTFLDKIALVVLISALAMKAGIVPMHMWLPDSYGSAPAPVTLILIGTTQASLYGAFRVIFTVYGGVFSDTASAPNVIGAFLVILALTTMLIGVIMALRQSNLKRMIAYVAVAEIGYMVLGIGARLNAAFYDKVTQTTVWPAYTTTALQGSILHIMNDALTIGLLFLVAGSIYYATKKISVDQLGGLARNMKYTTIFFMIGLFAAAGMPPMNGFVSKLLIYESTYQLNPILAIVAMLTSIMILAVFVKVFHSIFLGPEQKSMKETKEVPKPMLIAMGIIACIIIFIGLFPGFVITNLVEPATTAILNHTQYIGAVLGGI